MPDERRREELRRALYRPGSGGDEVRAYLEAAPAARARDAVPAPRQPRAATPAPATEAVRARRPVLAGVLALLVLAVTAATGPAPSLVLADPRAGTFSSPFPVTAPAVTVAAARSGAVSVWSAVRSTSPYARTGGVAVASARGSIRLSAVIDHVAAAHEPEGPLTVFVACDGRPVRIAFFTQVADFDEGYSAELNARSIPCTGIAAVRYRPPRGIVADGILVSLGGSGDIAVSVVEGL